MCHLILVIHAVKYNTTITTGHRTCERRIGCIDKNWYSKNAFEKLRRLSASDTSNCIITWFFCLFVCIQKFIIVRLRQSYIHSTAFVVMMLQVFCFARSHSRDLWHRWINNKRFVFNHKYRFVLDSVYNYKLYRTTTTTTVVVEQCGFSYCPCKTFDTQGLHWIDCCGCSFLHWWLNKHDNRTECTPFCCSLCFIFVFFLLLSTRVHYYKAYFNIRSCN